MTKVEDTWDDLVAEMGRAYSNATCRSNWSEDFWCPGEFPPPSLEAFLGWAQSGIRFTLKNYKHHYNFWFCTAKRYTGDNEAARKLGLISLIDRYGHHNYYDWNTTDFIPYEYPKL